MAKDWIYELSTTLEKIINGTIGFFMGMIGIARKISKGMDKADKKFEKSYSKIDKGLDRIFKIGK